MVQSRIKPHRELVEARQKRDVQQRLFRRRQVYGLLLIAAVIAIWWLFHTDPAWIFPLGWWRF